MKYVSPIYEVELISCEDIMLSANKMMAALGIDCSGDKTAITENVTIHLTDSNGSTEGVSQDPESTDASGIIFSMNFGGLFN